MKLTKIKVGGREFSLAFTLDAMCELQDTIKDFNLGNLSDYVKTPGGMLDLLTALARQGEILEGRVPDFDRHWFGSRISPAPARIAAIQMKILDALAQGMKMDMESEDDEEVDVVLEDLKKKDGTAG